MTKLLTITVPSYHTEKYIDECLPTLLDPRINDVVEIIMVNDGSTDGTLGKLKAYELQFPETIRVIDKENGGHGSTINVGLANASGKYFRVIDGDDWVNTEALVSYVEQLKTIDSDVVITPYEEHLFPDRQIKVIDYPFESGKVYAYDEVFNLTHHIPMMHAITYRTKLLRDNGITISEKSFYVDMEYVVFPMAFIQTLAYVSEKVYCYRLGTAEQSVNPKNYVKNRVMHRNVVLNLIRAYTRLQQKMPHAKRVDVLRQRLLREVVLDVHICLLLDDMPTLKREFFEYRQSVLAANAYFWEYTPSLKIKLLSKNIPGLFSLFSKRVKNMW